MAKFPKNLIYSVMKCDNVVFIDDLSRFQAVDWVEKSYFLIRLISDHGGGSICAKYHGQIMLLFV